jgi:ligand-binding sensor domain-containing protein
MKKICFLFCTLLCSNISPLSAQIVNQMTFTRFHHYEIDDWVTYAPALDIISISVGEEYIYFGTRYGGILRYHVYEDFWDDPFTTSSGLKNNYIIEVVYDSQNNKIYARTPEGINEFNSAFNYWEFIGSGNMPPQRYPLQSNLDDYLQDGNYRFPEFYRPQIKELPDFFTGIKYIFRPPDEVLDENNQIFKINNEIVVDRRRNLWLGTNGLGIAKASLDDYNLSFYQKSISNIIPQDLYFDKNEIWIAGLNTGNGPGGINYWNYDTDKWKYYEAQFNQGIYNDNCYAVNGFNSYIFFGSREGLVRYDKKKNEWKTFTTVNGLESNKINHLYKFGKILFIATDEGFNWMTSDYNRIEESKDTMLDNVPVYKISSSKNLIYMATKNGIYTYNMEKDQTRFFKTRSAALDLYISAINIQNNVLWIAGRYGISMYDQENDSWQSFIGIQTVVKGEIHAINFTKGNVWFATDDGLLKYDMDRDFWYLYTVEDGLTDNQVYNIIPDREDLWLCTKRGVCIFRWDRPGRFE